MHIRICVALKRAKHPSTDCSCGIIGRLCAAADDAIAAAVRRPAARQRGRRRFALRKTLTSASSRLADASHLPGAGGLAGASLASKLRHAAAGKSARE